MTDATDTTTEEEKTQKISQTSFTTRSPDTPMQDNVIDFTEKKLVHMINRAPVKRKMILIALLHDYRKGAAAVAWRSGEPVYLRIEPKKPMNSATDV